MNSEFSEQDELQPSTEAFIDMRLMDQMADIKDLCVAFAQKPLAENAQPLSEALSLHLVSLRMALEQVDNGSASYKNFNAIIDYTQGLEINRVTFLNEISGKENEHYAVSSDYDELRERMLDFEDCEGNCGDEDCNSEGVTDHLYSVYAESLQNHINNFSAISASIYGNLPSTKRKEKLRKIGFEALGIAKITLGTVAGVAIAKKLKLL